MEASDFTQTTTAEVHALCRQDFRFFVQKAFSCLFPQSELDHNWHIDAIAHHLQLCHDQKIRRLMINLPPRALKSLIVSVFYPAYYIGRNPSKTVLVVSHSLDLSTKLSNQFRQLISHPEIKQIFPVFADVMFKDSEREVVTSSNGGRFTTSVEGNVTGRGGHVIIVDDPLDASDADNVEKCNNVKKWIDTTLATRLDKLATDPIIFVMQRLSIFDPVPHLLEQESWTHLNLPAISTQDQKIATGDDQYYLWKRGDLLHASRFPQDYLDTRRKAMGTHAFEAQFQQNPVPDGGGYIDVRKFGRYKKLSKIYDAKILSIDTASGMEKGSYTVIIMARIKDGRLYITKIWRARYQYTDILDLTKSIIERYDINHLVIEHAVNGPALSSALRNHYRHNAKSRCFPAFIQDLRPDDSKILRMEREMEKVISGKVLLPESAPWLDAFLTELRSFPGGRYNDQVDALSQAIKYFSWYIKQPDYSPRRE